MGVKGASARGDAPAWKGGGPKDLHLSLPSLRMLEDDLKLSSDDEDGEQVRLPVALLSCR